MYSKILKTQIHAGRWGSIWLKHQHSRGRLGKKDCKLKASLNHSEFTGEGGLEEEEADEEEQEEEQKNRKGKGQEGKECGEEEKEDKEKNKEEEEKWSPQ